MEMKERFFERYENAVHEYFDYNGDDTGKLIRGYIMDEYKDILVEEFKVPEKDVSKRYHEIYAQTYYNGINIREYASWLREKFGREFFAQIKDNPAAIYHYYVAIHDFDMGVTDADGYAWLNTLLRYDIGVRRASEIINWYYEEMDTTVMEEVSIDQKKELENVCNFELGLHLDFSHWPKTEPKALEFGFSQFDFRD